MGGGGVREGGQYPLEHRFKERVSQLVYSILRGFFCYGGIHLVRAQ